jgi:hypothetical protein
MAMTRGERAEIVKEARDCTSRFPDRFHNGWLVSLAKVADEPGPVLEIIKEIKSANNK